MKKTSSLLLLASPLVLRMFTPAACGQVQLLSSPSITKSAGAVVSQIPSNSVSQIATWGTTVWVGTGKGVARTSDGGRTFVSYRGVPQFPRPGIFAMDVKGDTVWCATGYVEDVQAGGTVQTGTGYAYSFDDGVTWNSASQPLDGRSDSVVMYGVNVIHFLPIVVPEQNVTFRLAVTDSALWAASWSSGLRKSTNNGLTWARIVLPGNRSNISPTDSLSALDRTIDPRQNNNYLVFSVFVENPYTVWAGSAGGINRSYDGGLSWSKFTVDNEQSHILGNWVVSIRGQHLGNHTRIWATNWPADSPDEQYAVSCTDDSGATWRTFLVGVKAYDFAFKDSVVYVAADQGLFRSSDGGYSWNVSGSIVDPVRGNTLTTSSFYAVGVVADTVYGGNADGLTKTIDDVLHPFGEKWDVLRTSVPVGALTSTYAYPNPFSPRLQPVRFHYSTGGTPGAVTIEVFDFGMNRVRTVVRDAQRGGTSEHDEIWDGRNDAGTLVVNGVYFYRVTVSGRDPAWGKVMVIQ